MPLLNKTTIGINLTKFIEKVFGLKHSTPSVENVQNSEFVTEYQRTSGVPNYRYITANKVANLTAYSSSLSVSGDSEMAKFLNELLEPYMTKGLQSITSRMCGTGGIILKPCTYKLDATNKNVSRARVIEGLQSDLNNEGISAEKKQDAKRILNKITQEDFQTKTDVQILYQDALIDYDKIGSRMNWAVFQIDEITIKEITYILLESHELLSNGAYIVQIKAVRADYSDYEVPLDTIPKWASIEPWKVLEDVKQMLFGIIRCPADKRTEFDDPFGVPLDYGQDGIKAKIIEAFETLDEEFKLKQPRLGFDARLYTEYDENGNKLPMEKRLVKMFIDVPDTQGFEVFAPTYQEQSVLSLIESYFKQYESGMGLSAGIYTKLETAMATATEIKSANKDTLTVIGSCRTRIKEGFEQLAYACSIYAENNEGISQGEYEITADWDYSLAESTTERFTQLKESYQMGWVHDYEGRAWVMDESNDTAKTNLPGGQGEE